MKIYFLGILGISQSGLAEILLTQKCEFTQSSESEFGDEGADIKTNQAIYALNTVAGSDRLDNIELRKHLESLGIKIFIGHKKENIKKINPDLVVYNGAIADDNEELVWAKQNNIKTITRAECLGKMAEHFKNVVAISGCHGKTTTTAITSCAICSKNPTTHCGGEIKIMQNAQFKTPNNNKTNPAANNDCNLAYKKEIAKATIIGQKDYFITEACEFKASMLEIKPDVGVVLNIDSDHLDYYKNLSNVKKAFEAFAKGIKKDGVLIYNSDDNNSKMLKQMTLDGVNKISFGFGKDADFYPCSIRQNREGISFKVNGVEGTRFYVKAFGMHNVLNALVAIIVGLYLGLNSKEVRANLKTFIGVKRRMEEIKNNLGLTIIHDYAHHPAEIKVTIKTVKEHFKKQVVVIFQPHTYTRTKSLWEEHKTCFDDADKTIIVPIYSARETPILNITSKNLAKEIKNCEHQQSFADAKDSALEFAKANDAIILMLGAGDIVNMTALF